MFALGTQSAALLFGDEFTSLSIRGGAAGTMWDTSYPWGPDTPINDEQQYYVDTARDGTVYSGGNDPFSQSGSVLTIKADHAVAGTANGKPYTSGVLTSYHLFSHRYGYVEGRFKMPKGQSLWPAFWLYPLPGGTRAELDILEFIGTNDGMLWHTSVHSGDAVPMPPNTVTGISEGHVLPCDPTVSFNSYGIDWQPGTVVFYFNQVAYLTFATPLDCHVPMHLILNLATGGNWPGPVVEATPSQIPALLQADWVHWWDRPPF